MKIYLTAIFLFVSYLTNAQFSDDFSDGDFEIDPVWSGNVDKFIITDDDELKLDAPAESDTAYLSLTNSIMNDVVWDFYLRLDFNPSSSNLARIYLVSDQPDLKSALNGYFVQIGHTNDEISLYQQTGITVTKIIDGADDAVNADLVEVRIQVIRDDIGNWELLRDTLGGHEFISEGSVFDDTYATTSFFGVYAKYSTTRSDKFFFDDLGTPYEDRTPPTLLSYNVISHSQIDLLFSETMEEISAENNANYIVDGGIGNPSSVVLDDALPSQVSLFFDETFTNLTSYNLSLENINDLAGNSIVTAAVPFTFIDISIGQVNDIVFSEIFADPSPVIGLPEVEFLELYNRSDKVVDLNGWMLSDNLSTAVLSEYILLPDQYVLLCSNDDVELFGIENTLGLSSFPNLNNLTDSLVLKNADDVIIEDLVYTVEWYQDEDKRNGGWSLERKNIIDACSNDDNWSASINANGGTPGFENSVWNNEADITAPDLKNILAVNDSIFLILLTEPADSNLILEVSIQPEITDIEWHFITPNLIQLTFLGLKSNELYDLTVLNAVDCWGNTKRIETIIGVPSPPAENDLILNEILFNPITGASDYIEIYNNSEKLIDLSEVYIGNWDDGISNTKQVTTQRTLLPPHNFKLITEDTSAIGLNYSIYDAASLIEGDLPSFPNDSGTVYLLGPSNQILDFLNYTEKMQFSLLDDFDGKGLERIKYDDVQNNPDNWHTASEAVDWGTPGYINSQYQQTKEFGEVSIDPQLFSPDNDGHNDVLTINLNFTKPDLIVDIEIYDNYGRIIRNLEDNFFMGKTALFTWDGINNDGFKAGIGTYIVYATVRDQAGWRKVYKNVVVLAGRF